MSEKNLVICDREIGYGNSLGENIEKREELAVKVHICSSPEKVHELMQGRTIHILVADDAFTQKERSCIGAEQVFVLCKERTEGLGEEECAIYKYQCAEEIIRIIFESYLEQHEGNIMRPIRKEQAKLIAVYSPIHRVGKTRFAIALGKEFAEQERVLYLNLEEFAGFVEFDEEGQDLGDMLYYIRQGSGNLGIRLGSAVRKMDRLEYLLPIPFVSDLKEVTFAEWQMLLEQIMENSVYGRIILDIGEGVQGLFRMLQMCDRVYMPISEDDISTQKLKRYEKTIEELQLEDLARKTYRFVLPEDVEGYVKVRAKEEY